MTGRRGSVAERWLRHVGRSEADGCILWTGGLDPGGYGRINVDGQNRLAHRIGYELFVGPIPAGLTLDHECHNRDALCLDGRACRHRRCVNLDHLAPATRKWNSLSGHAPSVLIHHSGACARGHERSVHGYARKDRPGSFNCRECRREDRADGRYL